VIQNDDANDRQEGSNQQMTDYQIPGWQSGIAASYRGDPRLRDMDVPTKLVEAYFDAQSKLSQYEGRTYIPGEGATSEEWGAYRKAMGVPDTKDGYEFPLPEDMDRNMMGSMADWFRDVAFENGIPKDLANNMFQRWAKDTKMTMEENHKKERAAAEERTKALQEKYGEKWEDRKKAAHEFAKGKMGESVYNDMVQKNLLDNPDYLDALGTLHEMTSEDTLPGNGGSAGGVDRSAEESALDGLFPTMS
jgi:hypothetical protein